MQYFITDLSFQSQHMYLVGKVILVNKAIVYAYYTLVFKAPPGGFQEPTT